MPDCIIKSGEIVGLEDSRLNDPGCTIEAGVIIRPPLAPEVDTPKQIEEKKPKQSKKAKAKPEVVAVQKEEAAVKAEVKVPVPQKKVVTKEIIEVTPPVKDEGLSSSEIAAGAAILGVAAVGTAAATSAAGGFSVIQAKIASLFSSKGAVAGAAAVTAGTIVAVKALESKMGKLEQDMSKMKEEVGGAASSIDKIDELLNRLSGDGNNKLDPPV